ncbi:MAG: ABC transporter permease [Lachnospiraceae bacterium]|nr:ABC transporter permease [Lachnospiraceae bacterium]
MNPGEKRPIYQSRLFKQILVIGFLALFFIISNAIVGGKILTWVNIRSILMTSVFSIIVAVGLTFNNAAGVVDLSVGASIILACSFSSIVVQDFNFGYAGLIIVSLVVCILCEIITYSLIVFLKLPAWIAGLCMAMIYEAIATVFMLGRVETSGTSIIYLKVCRALGRFPGIFVVAAVVLVIGYFLYNKTSFSMNIRAMGSNSAVSEAVGIGRIKTMFTAALLAGCMFGIAAVVQLSYVGQITPQNGLGSLSTIFKPLATTLLAGSFSRIFNRMIGVALSAIFIASLFNVLTMLGVPSGTGQEITLGLSVILCGALSNMGNQKVVK